MKREKTCCFTGHRQIKEDFVRPVLKNAIEDLVTISGVTHFCNGGALGFDLLAAELVLALKKEIPEISLAMYLPCPEQTNRWPKAARLRYENILAAADEIVCLASAYHPGCMQKRNRALVDASAYCLCFCIKDFGGTAYTVRYAAKKGLIIHNLAIEMEQKEKR